MNKKFLIMSVGYWFSSRTLGLLTHPYITVKEIIRDRFMRPLLLSPVVFWIISWVLGMVLTRVGMVFNWGRFGFSELLAHGLLFVWVWGIVFCLLWQMVIGYLWIRFKDVA